jgi:hypothetical protein
MDTQQSLLRKGVIPGLRDGPGRFHPDDEDYPPDLFSDRSPGLERTSPETGLFLPALRDMKRTFLSLLILLIFVVKAQAGQIDIAAFIQGAPVAYESSFTVDSSPEVWNKVLDHPDLMGKLWEVYGFRPAYQVTRKGTAFRVVDPTGLEGDLTRMKATSQSRIFYGVGRINHWAVPFDIAGRALFIFTYRLQEGKVLGKVEIYVAGDGRFADFLLKIFSPLMRYYIGERFRHNLDDARTIISDILRDPGKIRKQLSGKSLKEFDSTFY